MSRPASLALLVIGLLAAGCVNVAAPPEASTPPTVAITAPVPSLEIATASPTAQSEPTDLATPTESPTASPTEARTTAPTTSVAPTTMTSPTPSASECDLVTVDEMSLVMGEQATLGDGNTDTDCTYVLADFAAVDISTDVGDLETTRILLGKSAKNIEVAGLPALSGTFIGQPMVFVQKGDSQLTVMGLLLNGKKGVVIAKLAQIAAIAVGRWQ